jgi:hypothetical protein
MYTPDTPHDDLETVIPDWHEPFPEPQTIPSGWDLSEFLSVSASAIHTLYWDFLCHKHYLKKFGMRMS